MEVETDVNSGHQVKLKSLGVLGWGFFAISSQNQRSACLCLLSAEIKGPVGPRHCNKPHLDQEDSRVPGEAAERRVAREDLALLRALVLFICCFI